MRSPVINQVNTIFVHVSDLEKSVEWYCKLLGKKFDPNQVKKPVFNISLNEYTGITLDAGQVETKKFTPLPYALFNLHTNDINESFKFAKESNFKIAQEIIDFGDLAFFNLYDPDKNIIMICTG
ncbi:VOC family protein [Virgibacillus proomii]|uniref:VOC family protein n=1 Tax=Virgibacillus proomii TaxID=84407 RepID=UPI001C1157A3|nr:VOC family protein [Virgibacillus proomii]MBU5267690.1 VOC family protein [Virgibacillus proomii]